MIDIKTVVKELTNLKEDEPVPTSLVHDTLRLITGVTEEQWNDDELDLRLVLLPNTQVLDELTNSDVAVSLGFNTRDHEVTYKFYNVANKAQLFAAVFDLSKYTDWIRSTGLDIMPSLSIH